MDIRERIRLIRKDQGLKQKDFGEKLGVTDAAISRIESGQRGVTDQMKKSICTLFNINLEWLEHGTGDMYNRFSEEKRLGSYLGRIGSRKYPQLERIIMCYFNLSEEGQKVVDNFIDLIVKEEDQSK